MTESEITVRQMTCLQTPGEILRRWVGEKLRHRLHREPLPLGAGCRHCDQRRLSLLVDMACQGPVEAAAVSQVLREHYAAERR